MASAASSGNSKVGRYLVTEEEYKTLTEFTQTKTFKARRDRVSEYFRSDLATEVAIKCLVTGGGTTLAFTTTGAITGACIGGPKGAGIGALAGLGTGLIVTFSYGGYKIHQNYHDWICSTEEKGIIEKFKEEYRKKPVLEDFLDPITTEPFKDPVITPCGHTYEKASIVDWIERSQKDKKVPSCPECRAKIDKKDLSTDIVMIGKMKRAYAECARYEENNDIYSPHIKNAFQALHKDLEFQAQEVLKKVSGHLTLQLNEGKITPEAFSRKMKELLEMYQPESSNK